MTNAQRNLMLKVARNPGSVSTADFTAAGLPFEAFLRYSQVPSPILKERALTALMNQA